MFSGANRRNLVDLYGNARELVLNPFAGTHATAFGLNFELDVVFSNLDRNAAMAQMLGEGLREGFTNKAVTVAREDTSYRFELSNLNPDGIFLHINNHIGEPGLASFTADQLETRLDALYEQNINVIREINQCIQPQQG